MTTSKDKLVWKWLKGQATTFCDFGVSRRTPSGTTAYTLCVYSNTSAVLGVTIPTSSPNWTVIGANKGYKYKDLAGGRRRSEGVAESRRHRQSQGPSQGQGQ